MRKMLLVSVAIILAGFSQAWAGHFTDILPPAAAAGCAPVSNGYDYNCTTDSGATGLVIPSKSSTTFSTLVPSTTGQVFTCSNCSQTPICVSTGTGKGAWVGVSGSSIAASGFGSCQ